MLGGVGKSGRKFLFAGRGMSVRTGRYLGEATLVGAATGLAVVVFKWMIDFAHRLHGMLADRVEFTWTSPARWAMFALPALGALAGHILIKRFSKLEHARGTDSAIRAYHQRDGYVTGTVIPVKPVASVLTVGAGGSAGYEGPVTLLGAACGSVIARSMKLSLRARRILMAAGLSAGIAALFQAPLAGAIFGFEIFYSSSDIEDEIFTLDSRFAFSNGLRLVPYSLLAVVVAFGVRFYISFFRATEKTFAEMRMAEWMKVVCGGLVTGAIGFFFPDILGEGYSIVRAVFLMEDGGTLTGMASLTAAGLFAVFALKVVATSFTVGSGGSGGLFAPALVCGGALGAATGILCHHLLPGVFDVHPAAFALVGMAGFMASALRIPLTAIVMVAEMSGNHGLLLPAMWVCGISFWLNSGWSLYRSQVHSQESSPVHRGTRGRSV